MRSLPFRSALLVTCALLFGGCCDSRFGERPRSGETPPATTTIARLCELFEGEAVVITRDLTVAGRVTTSDRDENFYRSFCIADEEAGMEIMAGTDHLHNDYPTGTLVTVRLKGFALGRSRGVLQVGRLPEEGSGFPTDYIAASRAALDRAVVRSDAEPRIPEPTTFALEDLAPTACGRLVRLDGLHYSPEELSPGSSWSGYRRFTDDDGLEIFTYVRPYARFADREVPAGRCSLTGILQWDDTGDGRYILKLRDESDCRR